MIEHRQARTDGLVIEDVFEDSEAYTGAALRLPVGSLVAALLGGGSSNNVQASMPCGFLIDGRYDGWKYPIALERAYILKVWRREWDSNPRYAFTYTRSPGVRLRPLGHLSGASNSSR